MLTGILHWGRKKALGTDQSSWYDTTTYRVPVTGKIDCSKISSVLRKTHFPPAYNYFGGYCTLGSVREDTENKGHVLVDVIYHIGH